MKKAWKSSILLEEKIFNSNLMKSVQTFIFFFPAVWAWEPCPADPLSDMINDV